MGIFAVLCSVVLLGSSIVLDLTDWDPGLSLTDRHTILASTFSAVPPVHALWFKLAASLERHLDRVIS